MELKINTAKALQLLELVLEKYGEDHRYCPVDESTGPAYLTCSYWHPQAVETFLGGNWFTAEEIEAGEPGCLVGAALYLAGATPQQLFSLDVSPEYDAGLGAGHLYEVFPGITKDACALFEQAQGIQDSRYTWGKTMKLVRDWYKIQTRCLPEEEKTFQ